MAGMRQLVKDTAIYGMSTILGKFLNWLLVPMYSYVLSGSDQYGIVANLYAWTALVTVIITYGMETAMFRFINSRKDAEGGSNRVYSTALSSLAVSSLIFAVVVFFFSNPIASSLETGATGNMVAMMGIIVALDAFASIPFAYLRHINSALHFSIIKILNVLITIAFNIIFLIQMKKGVEYVFVANLIASVVVVIMLIPTVLKAKHDFNWQLWREMFRFGFPMMLLGIVGIMNQTMDKILFPIVYPDNAEGMAELGIYSACFKVAMIMMMFTNAFRYAYEPFIFQKYGSRDCKESYSDAMKWYLIASFFIFLAMVYYLDIIQYLLQEQYRVGLKIVPFVLISYIFQGVVYNLALWYKVIGNTWWGTVIAGSGFIVSFILQIWLIPVYSYWACVWASIGCYFVMVIVSYALGQKYYPINYQLKRIGCYTLFTTAFLFIGILTDLGNIWLNWGLRALLLLVFVVMVVKFENIKLKK